MGRILTFLPHHFDMQFEYRDFELALPSFCDLAEEGYGIDTYT